MQQQHKESRVRRELGIGEPRVKVIIQNLYTFIEVLEPEIGAVIGEGGADILYGAVAPQSPQKKLFKRINQ